MVCLGETHDLSPALELHSPPGSHRGRVPATAASTKVSDTAQMSFRLRADACALSPRGSRGPMSPSNPAPTHATPSRLYCMHYKGDFHASDSPATLFV
mmetsp:Transcript_18448/g.31997  ORF Transcript_18448/g.31997 Transcript_18448/m.31997 type:complete len:98 (+) Transcript_18448:209-502(+)